MPNDNLKFKLKVRLLEDLHSGTGTGNLLVDDLQARNAKGRPFIDREHFRGVLKDNALRLKALGHMEQQDIDRLFGKAGGSQPRKLDCSSLVAEDKDCLITWTSTARREGSRCPEDHSLRSIQYITAGTMLEGRIQIAEPKDGDEELLKKLLRFTVRLGGGRTRGDGQIKIEWEQDSEEAPAMTSQSTAQTTLRLLLRAEESLCIPATGHPGNIISSESYIPGRLLFAALCQKLGVPDMKTLFTGQLQVGNALPLPPGEYGPQTEVMPMPAHLYQIKPAMAASPSNSRWPHWAAPQKTEDLATELKEGRDVDHLAYKGEAQTSRPKGHLYLVKDEQGQWRRYRQPLEVRMRNQRGDPFDNSLKREDTELFTVERIPADTRFVAEIHCKDETLREKLWPLLQPGQRFHLGRGKAPVKILKAGGPPALPPSEVPGSLTLIAQSDWLILGDNLGYLDELNETTLLRCAFGIKDPDNDYPNLKLESCQETETHGSYNYATRLPRLPQAVIRRGSVFRLYGAQAELDKLRNHLKAHGPVGQRTTEGYGQFLLEPALPDFLRKESVPVSDPVASPPQEDEPPPETEDTPKPQEADQQPASRPATDAGEQTPESTDTSVQEEPPNEEDEACAEQASKAARDYFDEIKERLPDELPDLERWQLLKQALIESDFPMEIKQEQPEEIQACFHQALGIKSLFQHLNSRLRPPDQCDPVSYKTHFLNALESHLYREEQS